MVTEPVAVTTFPIGAVSRFPVEGRPGLFCACAPAGRPPPAYNSAAPINTTAASVRMVLLAKRENYHGSLLGTNALSPFGRLRRHLGSTKRDFRAPVIIPWPGLF